MMHLPSTAFSVVLAVLFSLALAQTDPDVNRNGIATVLLERCCSLALTRGEAYRVHLWAPS